jgi:hypothetical protein
VLRRGDLRAPVERALPGAPPLWSDAPADFIRSEEYDEADARVALAHYVTHDENPLLWRSMANRLWQWTFGTPLVATPNDFGRMGQRPTHPELLDVLAASLRDDPQQSIKRIVRALLRTRAYRRASRAEDPVWARHIEANRAIDASNSLRWRGERRRLTAEEFRDTLLEVSGLLRRQPRGGPSFEDFVIERPQHSPHYEYRLHDPLDPAAHRRSVYRFVVRSQPQPMLTTLDCANPSISVPRRDESTTALQALTQWNDRLVAAMAVQFARRLRREAGAVRYREQVVRGCRLAWGRPPSAAELDVLAALATEEGTETLCRVLYNASAMMYLD